MRYECGRFSVDAFHEAESVRCVCVSRICFFTECVRVSDLFLH